MCCGVGEDCTNDIDDDGDVWADCVDHSDCSVHGSESVCGLSDNFDQSPSCSWLSSECVGGVCDFTPYTEPVWANNHYGYNIPQSGYNSCRLTYISGSWVPFSCDPADPPSVSDIVLPSSVDQGVVDVNNAYGAGTVDRYELYAMCRLWHCSAGRNNDLPPYVADMENESYKARHCCPLGQYWNPDKKRCADTKTCYDPQDIDSYPCRADFATERAEWVDDVYGATTPGFEPLDCVQDSKLLAGDTKEVLCCPKWIGGKNDYAYSDIEYYIQG